MNPKCSLNPSSMLKTAHHPLSMFPLMPPKSGVTQRNYSFSKSLQVQWSSAKLKYYSTNASRKDPHPCLIKKTSMPKRDQLGSWPGVWRTDLDHHYCSKCSLKRKVEEYPIVAADSDQLEEQFTVEDAIKTVGFGAFQVLLLVYAGMAWTAEAMEMMLLSFVGPSVKDIWHLTAREESYITSAVFVGMMIGAYSWGFLSDSKGRRVGFFATSVLTFIAGLLSAFSSNYWELLLLRGLVGVGLGGGPVVSTWFMEFVPSANRGLWMIVMTTFWTLGSVVEALLAWKVMPGLGWRWLLGLSSVPLAVLLLFYPLVPESPRFLASRGRITETWDVLKGMARLNKKPLPAGSLTPTVSTQTASGHHDVAAFEHDQKNFTKEATGSEAAPLSRQSSDLDTSKVDAHSSAPSPKNEADTKATLLSPGTRQSTFLLWAVFFANAFTYYGLVLLTTQLTGDAGGCGQDSAVQHSVESANDNMYREVLVTSLAAAGIVDVYGRKPSMAALFILSGVFLLPLVQHQSETVTTALLFGARASIMGAFTVLYIYAPEVYPTGLRSTGLGIANSFARVGGFVCPYVAVELVQSCQQSLAVGVFAVMPVAAGLLALNFPTETKGRAL